MPNPSSIAHPIDLDVADGSYVTEAEYWKHYYEGTDYEWNNGRLEAKPVSDYLTDQTYLWFIKLLQLFLDIKPIAGLVALDFGSRLVLPDKITIRKPDLGLILHDNRVPIESLDRTYKGVFDLCVEALSDSNTANRNRDLVTKKAEYATAGVAEYFVLHHKRRYQAFYTLTDRGVYTPIQLQDGVIHSLVLPGFCFRVDDLNRKPDMDTLRNDPVYQAFVLPGWQAAEARAEAEQQRAEAEQQRAEAAEYRAQRLAEQLRALGIDPDI